MQYLDGIVTAQIIDLLAIVDTFTKHGLKYGR
jgi:hypothetical protein